jgi:hypothetical protein
MNLEEENTMVSQGLDVDIWRGKYQGLGRVVCSVRATGVAQLTISRILLVDKLEAVLEEGFDGR